jgi:hypothetical protein
MARQPQQHVLGGVLDGTHELLLSNTDTAKKTVSTAADALKGTAVIGLYFR